MQNASERFQSLQQVYSILSDEEKYVLLLPCGCAMFCVNEALCTEMECILSHR